VLRKKYLIMLASFVAFQTIGISLANYILISVDPSFPPLGGVLTFLTFLFIGMALVIKEEKIPLASTAIAKDFNTVYSSFLTVLYNSTVGTGLGEESFKFTNFIKESMIEKEVSLSKGGIVFKRPSHLDIKGLINQNLSFLEKHFANSEVTDCYLRVLDVAFYMLKEEFDFVVRENEEFLKKSDLIYGIGGGYYLDRINEDRILHNLTDIDACLRIYKRLLLPVADWIGGSIESQKRLIMYYATKNIKITEFGEVLMQDVPSSIAKVPEEERLVIIIESFNSFVSWVYERILTNLGVEVQSVLQPLHRVLELNSERANDLNINYTFLERLATRIPKTQIQSLYSEHLKELVDARTSELREIQKRLLETERMAAIGETAAMVGHDLRNPLLVIFNTLYMAKNKLTSLSAPSDQKQRLKELFETVGNQADYMNKIVSDLQDYARPLRLEPVEIDLPSLLDNVISSAIMPGNIKASIIIGEDFPKIYVDPALMKRVFTNLVSNAVQAMPEGGELTITARLEGDKVLISVADTGEGISKENLGKLFSPLFTTKARGQGFGLAVCKRLVEAHDGKIKVDSQVGKGSDFTIELPLKAEDLKEKISPNEEIA
jgi:signal transduction histidine kinase